MYHSLVAFIIMSRLVLFPDCTVMEITESKVERVVHEKKAVFCPSPQMLELEMELKINKSKAVAQGWLLSVFVFCHSVQ